MNLSFHNLMANWSCICLLKSLQMVLWALYYTVFSVMWLNSWHMTCQHVAFIHPVPAATIDLRHVSVFFFSLLPLLYCFFCCSFLMQNLLSFSRRKYHGILFCISLYILLYKALFLRFLFTSAFLFNLFPALFFLLLFLTFFFHLRDHVRAEQIIVVWPVLLLLWQENIGDEPWNSPQKGCS